MKPFNEYDSRIQFYVLIGSIFLLFLVTCIYIIYPTIKHVTLINRLNAQNTFSNYNVEYNVVDSTYILNLTNSYDLLSFIKVYSDKYDITINEIFAQTNESKESHIITKQKVVLSGDFINLLKFIHEFENTNTGYVIENLVLSNPTKNTRNEPFLNLSFVVKKIKFI